LPVPAHLYSISLKSVNTGGLPAVLTWAKLAYSYAATTALCGEYWTWDGVQVSLTSA
jgi:hypothetical protein